MTNSSECTNESIERHIVLDGMCNLRDLGGYQVAGGSRIRWRRVLRSDSLHNLSESGVGALIDAGLASVIDLRGESEIAHQPNPFQRHDDVRYQHVPLFASLDLRDNIGRQTSGGDMLLELYCDVLTHRQSALIAALSAIADAGPGAVLFHCTVGKDRTGMLAALVLAAVGASPEDIISDYALSTGRIAEIQERMLAEFSAGGLDAQSLLPLFSSEPATMRGMLDFLDSRYGGINAYLQALDPDRAVQEKLRARMLQ